MRRQSRDFDYQVLGLVAESWGKRKSLKEIRLLYTTRPAAWNKSRPPSRHSRPANLHEYNNRGMYIEKSGFRRGEWCSCNAIKVEQFIALRISPADISIIDSNSGFGMTFKAGMAWIALSIIVLAMGLNLRQRRNARNERDVGSRRMVENVISQQSLYRQSFSSICRRISEIFSRTDFWFSDDEHNWILYTWRIEKLAQRSLEKVTRLCHKCRRSNCVGKVLDQDDLMCRRFQRRVPLRILQKRREFPRQRLNFYLSTRRWGCKNHLSERPVWVRRPDWSIQWFVRHDFLLNSVL